MRKLISLVLALSLVGCANQGTLIKLGEQLAVSYATMRFVEQNPQHVERIREITAIVKAAISTDTTATVETIYRLIESKIDFTKLTRPSDRYLVDSLLTVLQVALNERVGDKPGMLPVDKALAVNEVIGWIEAGIRSALPV